MPLSAQSAGYEIQDTLVIKAQLGSIWHLRTKIFSLWCIFSVFQQHVFFYSGDWGGSLWGPEEKSDIEICLKGPLCTLYISTICIHYVAMWRLLQTPGEVQPLEKNNHFLSWSIFWCCILEIGINRKTACYGSWKHFYWLLSQSWNGWTI